MERKRPKNSTKEKVKKDTKKGYKKTKQVAQKGKEKVDQARHSSIWQKTKKMAKKTASIVGSHLATARVSITMSNEEAKLMEKINNDLNKKGLYPSKSEILRAGLWSLRNKKSAEIEGAVKDLLKVKQTRVL
jgi:hypothetical protein